MVLFSPLIPKYDLEWLEILIGRFTLNFHYYEARFSNQVTYLCRVCLHMWPAEMWSAEYVESAKKLRIFRRRYIVGTLTTQSHLVLSAHASLSRHSNNLPFSPTTHFKAKLISTRVFHSRACKSCHSIRGFDEQFSSAQSAYSAGTVTSVLTEQYYTIVQTLLSFCR